MIFIQDPPERPKNYNFTVAGSGSDRVGEVVVQAWHATGEVCPEDTVPIRRTTEKDLLRASSLRRYGRKPVRQGVRRDSTSSGHEVCGSYKTFPFALQNEMNAINMSVRFFSFKQTLSMP